MSRKLKFLRIILPTLLVLGIMASFLGAAMPVSADSETLGFTTTAGASTASGVTYFGQSFTPANNILVSSAQLYLRSDSNYSSRTVQVQIRSAMNSGSLGTSSTTSVDTSFGWDTFSFGTGISLTAGTPYYLVISSASGSLRYEYNTADTSYAGGQRLTGSGGYTNYSGTTGDLLFIINNTILPSSYIVNTTGSSTSNDVTYFGQSFTPTQHISVTGAQLYMASGSSGGTSRDVRIDIRSSPNSGTLGTSSTLSVNTTIGWKTFAFSTPIELSAGTIYYLVISYASGDLDYQYNSSSSYAGGQRFTGSGYTSYSGTTGDLLFIIMNTVIKTTPTLSITNSPVTFNGSPQAAAVEGSVPGDVSDVKYDGSSTSPTNAGTYAVTADFAPTDTASYNSLNDASAGNFVIGKANQSITFGTLADKTFGDPDFTVSASASSGLPVSFSASGSCTVVGTTVHITGTGLCTITASQAGNGNYNAASDVSRSFNVSHADLTLTYTAGANGTISGTTPQTVNYGEDGTAVTAEASAHYHFVSWSDGSTDNPRTDSNVTANINVTASFALDQFTISFNSNGGSAVADITQDYGSTVNAPANPTKAGYTFAGWYSDSELNTPFTFPTTMPDSNTKLYAKWASNSQTWYLDSIGSPLNTMEKTLGIQVEGPVSLGSGPVTWISEGVSTNGLTFETGDWTVFLKSGSGDFTGTFDVALGESDGTPEGFSAFASVTGVSANGQYLTVIFPNVTGPTVTEGYHLAVQVTGSGSVSTDGTSFVSAPDSDPDFPLPEVAASVLFGLGVLGLAGYVFIRRKKAKTAQG